MIWLVIESPSSSYKYLTTTTTSEKSFLPYFRLVTYKTVFILRRL